MSEGSQRKELPKGEQHNSSDGKTNGASSTDSRNESSPTKKFKHPLELDPSEVDDDYEEFGPRSSISPAETQEDLHNRVNIWLNSWMDEDDGDFAGKISDADRSKP